MNISSAANTDPALEQVTFDSPATALGALHPQMGTPAAFAAGLAAGAGVIGAFAAGYTVGDAAAGGSDHPIVNA